ncbi:hypothetical protein M404DRAFT_849708 [Pisolithus tinctorius Marx 270]|uniref:Uncharacterized protein n=1 Tax=Pisolithus tinctorius Marx 270 TaxID=870435 RepID=A0A0C3JLY3_PISTI|nr:hypothetical protein M404DRAFT_849708 [Pisolithus tinctorius Marx 270]
MAQVRIIQVVVATRAARTIPMYVDAHGVLDYHCQRLCDVPVGTIIRICRCTSSRIARFTMPRIRVLATTGRILAQTMQEKRRCTGRYTRRYANVRQ